MTRIRSFLFFFFNDTATTEIYTLSLHDALPICLATAVRPRKRPRHIAIRRRADRSPLDRKSTRLNSSHSQISYAVFCLKKKKKSSRLTVGAGRVVCYRRRPRDDDVVQPSI